MIDGFDAEVLLADRAFDTDNVLEEATHRGMKIVIPPKRKRKKKREYDRYLYKVRHLVENGFYISKDGVELRPLCKKKRLSWRFSLRARLSSGVGSHFMRIMK